MSRPKSDVATLIGTVLAIVALVWSIYAYYVPRSTPEGSPTPTVSATPSQPAEQAHNTGSPASDPVTRWVQKTYHSILPVWSKLHGRWERDRHDRSWWALMLLWGMVAAYARWEAGRLFWSSPRVLATVLTIPGWGAVYLWYYWPSLNTFGVIVATLGFLGVMRQFTNYAIRYAHTARPASTTDAEPEDDESPEESGSN